MESEQLSSYIWQQLPIKHIIKLCRIDKTFAQLCSQKSTWQFLLKRDFNIDSYENPRKKYVKQLLERAALLTSKDADDRMKLINRFPSAISAIYTGVINSYKISQSFLGIDTSEKYFDFFGNRIGFAAKDHLNDLRNLDIQLRHNPDVGLLDVLIDIANGTDIGSV